MENIELFNNLDTKLYYELNQIIYDEKSISFDLSHRLLFNNIYQELGMELQHELNLELYEYH